MRNLAIDGLVELLMGALKSARVGNAPVTDRAPPGDYSSIPMITKKR
jgi:hypothetical protein